MGRRRRSFTDAGARRGKSRGQRSLDALIHQPHAGLLGHVANNQLGEIQVSHQSRRRRPIVSATPRVETAQAAGIRQAAAVNAEKSSQGAQRRNHEPANPVRGTAIAAERSGQTATTRCSCRHRSTAQDAQVTQLSKVLYRQTALISLLSLLFTFSCILPFASAQITHADNDHFIVFDQVGHMASSLGYIHVAIPLNISTYQHQITLFHNFLADFSSKTTSNPTQVSFTKAIRDLATFARKRVDKLVEQPSIYRRGFTRG